MLITVMHTERELRIDAYIHQHPDAKQLGILPIFYHGGFKEHEVYRLPMNLLVFNIGNGRFAAELMAEQKKANRQFDPTKENDVKIIQRLLLEQVPEETKALKDDLKRNGQIDPGIITHDGAVINANRRMAILKVLAEETGNE